MAIEKHCTYSRFSEKVLEHQRLKRQSFQVKLTTYIRGKLKNDFLDDCINRGDVESETIRSIVKLHYELIEAYPVLRGKEFSEIKLFLLTKSLP